MVKIGEVFWVASVQGVDSASADADELEGSMNSVAGTAQQAADAQNQYGDATEESAEATQRAGLLTRGLDTAQSLLGTTVFFVSSRFGVASTAATVYSGALGLATTATTALNIATGNLIASIAWVSGAVSTIVGLGKGFVAWLAAGSAGALAFAGAIGFALGVLGVWILEVTGALDAVQRFGAWVGNVLPGWVRDGLLQLLSVAVGPLAVFGGFITGFVEGGFDEGFRRAGQVVDVFIGAWDRQIGRVVSIAEGGWDALRSGWTSFKNWLFGVVDGIVNKIMAIPDAAAEAASSIPGSDIAAGAADAGGSFIGGAADTGGNILSGAGDLVGLQSGGMIREEGVARVHRGEAVLPRPIVEAAQRGESRPVRSGGGGGGDGDVTYDIEIGDQSLDLSTLDRSTLRELAVMISQELGTATGDLAGGK